MPAYSFINVNATLSGIGGVIDLGYGSAVAEEGIDIKMANDKNKLTIGADGEGMNTLRADKSGTITLRYLKTSPVNAQLMAMYDLQSLSTAAWGQNLITISQPGVGDLHTGRECAFKKKPDMTYKTEGDIIEWVFDAVKIDGVLGTY